MYTFIFLLVFGLLIATGIALAIYKDYQHYKNAWTFRAVVGYFLLGATLTFVVCTILLTARYGRMSEYVVSQF